MWSKNIILLFQGQAVSCFGSSLYSVVASLWAYEMTGSALIMGTVYSIGHIARLIMFPFSGILVDRFSRRDLIILCDILCGVSMLSVAISAATGSHFALTTLVIHSAVSGAVSSIFHPAVHTLTISLVGKDHFVKANSTYNAIEYGVDIIGQSISGLLYSCIGAPVLFFFDGITFLFSAVSELFIARDTPPVQPQQDNILTDATEGIRYILRNRGICYNLSAAFLINLAFGCLRVLLVPWMLEFGPACYGLLGTFRSIGTILGSLFLSAITVPKGKQYTYYFRCQFFYLSFVALAALIPYFPSIAALFCVAQFHQYIFNTLQSAAVFLTVPDQTRGKVICAVQALAMSFSALGNLAGGFFSEYAAPQYIIFLLMLLTLICILPLTKHHCVKALFSV